jgi:hypothetical protein
LSVAVASSTGHSSCSSSTAKTQARCTAASLRKRAVAAWTDASEAFAKLGLNSTQLFYRGAAAAHQDQNQRRPQNQRADGGRVGEQFAHSRAPGGPVEDTPDKDLDQLVGGLVQASVGTMAPRRVRFGKAAGSIIGHGRGCAPLVISLAPRPAARATAAAEPMRESPVRHFTPEDAPRYRSARKSHQWTPLSHGGALRGERPCRRRHQPQSPVARADDDSHTVLSVTCAASAPGTEHARAAATVAMDPPALCAPGTTAIDGSGIELPLGGACLAHGSAIRRRSRSRRAMRYRSKFRSNVIMLRTCCGLHLSPLAGRG